MLLVKPVPIEGTALIALERADVLRARGYDGGLHPPAPGVPARAGHQRGRARAAGRGDRRGACDARPDRGRRDDGLAGDGRGAGVGLEIDLDAIPIAPEGATLCREFGLDPLGTIASGAILMAVAERDAARLVRDAAARVIRRSRSAG